MPFVSDKRRSPLVVAWRFALGLAVSVGLFLGVTTIDTMSCCEGNPWRSSAQSLSWELSDAPKAATAKERAFLWLERNRASIKSAERTRRIDGLAIGGVIAYEALEHIHPETVRAIVRYDGPGKVNFKASHLPFEGDPVSKQVEELGYLPMQTMKSRAQILATDKGAITYIAAIMRAFSDIARSRGYDLRCRPDLLATFYTAWTLAQAQRLFESRPRSLRANWAGHWIAQQSFIADAIGQSDLCRPPHAYETQ